jgi:deoxyxylulose-5-phosphate synthase
MIRAIADDGAFGPVASGSLINVAVQIKELTVCAPTNVKDWQEVWEYFLTNKSPIFVAEHRNSYSQNDLAIMNSSTDNVVLISIGGTSILLPEVQSQLREHGIFASTYNILWLKPLKLTDSVKSHLTNAEHVVILDPGTKDYGVAAGIVHALGISSKSTILASSDSYPGYAEMLRSGVGDAQRITRTIIELINGRDR